MNTLRLIIFLPLALLATGAITSVTVGLVRAIPIGYMLDTGHLIAYGIMDAAYACFYMWIGMALAPRKGIDVALVLTTVLMLITVIFFIELSVSTNFHNYGTLIGRIVGSGLWYLYYFYKPKP